MREIEALIILRHLLSNRQIRDLITHFGSADKVLTAPKDILASVLGKKCKALQQWEEENSWKEDLKSVERQGVKLIPYWDVSYPSALHALNDYPVVLYVWGELIPEDNLAISIVGTRACSLYGKEMTEQFAKTLAGNSFTVVSGLARGIDTHAHLGALQTGRTIAILGSGLRCIYPKENTHLAEKISACGAVISEFPMHFGPAKHHFPRRNRIVSALSKGVFLAEAPLKSGAMITMDFALSQNKPCFALPGRADMESFRGNHALIKERKAHLVENAFEILAMFGKKTTEIQPHLEFDCDEGLDEEERILWKFFPNQEISFEELSLLSKLSAAKLSSLLMGLVLKRKIREFPGKVYKKVQ